MDSEEPNRKDKELSEEQGKENGRHGGDVSGSQASTVHSEHKQQERRKKAAMFLSRLKKGSKEEENSTQLVYGKRLLVLVPNTRIQRVTLMKILDIFES